MRLYGDGMLEASAAAVDGLATTTQAIHIGADPADTSGRSFNGWIDELRVTKWVGRYVTNFVPPAAAFPRF